MSKKLKIEFEGSQGDKLAGLLESPNAEPLAYVLFAHCFTCGKDLVAASRVARSLVARNFAVLRFDFTGLGSSDGDFANTNFSSNVQDLIKAADYLRQHYKAPEVLIGHSLGGTAILKAAHQIPESRGVVTIGAPADADHVIKQFAYDIETIETQGDSTVWLAGRSFTIKKQFIDDIRENNNTNVSKLGKPLLVMHSPVDSTVSIKQAEFIFTAAKHPKSFVSLGKADHLLTNKTDAESAAAIIATWASQFISEVQDAPKRAVATGHVMVSERDHKFAQNVYSDDHQWIADEPVAAGGSNYGPDPYEHLLAALGTCTAMTMRMYAARKKWPVDNISIELEHSRDHGADCVECDETHSKIDVISRKIIIDGNLQPDQKKRLMEIADKCPVHRTLHNKLVIRTELSD